MPKTIVIAYAWGFGNIGDAAITPGLLRLLERYAPEYRSVVLAETGVGRVRSYLNRHFKGCSVIADDTDEAFEGALREAAEALGDEFHAPGATAAEYALEVLPHRIIDRLGEESNTLIALNEAERVVYNSGMVLVYGEETLANRRFWRYTVRRSLPLLLARALSVPYGVYAHSFDSFDVAPGRPYFQTLLDDTAFCFCRDSSSLRYLQDLSIDPPATIFVPDSTLSFDGADDTWAEATVTACGLEPGRFMIVIPRTWRQDEITDRLVGEERSRAHMALLREVIERAYRQFGTRTLIAVEVESELSNARELVYEPLAEDVRAATIMRDRYWTPEQAASLYTLAAVVCTMELHSFLLAAGRGTPAVVPTFVESGRKIAMVGDFGLADWFFDIDRTDADSLVHTIGKTIRDPEMARARVRDDVLPRLRAIERDAVTIMTRGIADISQSC
ncbi:MAG: polysaccharide pyruvyl transferase family protein [Armatimonadota bacterium]